MDLVSAAVGLQQAKLLSEVQIKVAQKLLSSQSQQGATVEKLLTSATSGLDTAANNLSAAATGLGSQLDVTA